MARTTTAAAKPSSIKMENRAALVQHQLPRLSSFPKSHFSDQNALLCRPCCSSTKVHSTLEHPDVPHLAQTARISLNSRQVEEYAPKIRHIIEWFGQIQDVDLQAIEPASRADTEVDNLGEGAPEYLRIRKQ